MAWTIPGASSGAGAETIRSGTLCVADSDVSPASRLLPTDWCPKYTRDFARTSRSDFTSDGLNAVVSGWDPHPIARIAAHSHHTRRNSTDPSSCSSESQCNTRPPAAGIYPARTRTAGSAARDCTAMSSVTLSRPAERPDERHGGGAQEDRVHAGDDHREALVDVGPHGLGREAEDPDRYACGLTGRPDSFNRIANVPVVDGAGHPEARREIVRTDQDTIDTLHAHDRLDVGDGITVFRLNDDGGAVVGALHVFANFQAVAVRPGNAKSALSGRRVLGGLHDAPRVLGGVDLRHDDSRRTDIQRFLDRHVVARREPNDAWRRRCRLQQ